MEAQNQTKQIIAIGSDHAGFTLKENLKQFLIKQNKYEVKDQGPFSADRVDYPDFALKVTKNVLQLDDNLGVLVCGSGIGISVAANKVQGIRAAICHDDYTAQIAREKHNSNVIVFGDRIIGNEVAQHALTTFLNAKFDSENQLNVQRQEKLRKLEEKNLKDLSQYCSWCGVIEADKSLIITELPTYNSCKSCHSSYVYVQKAFPGKVIQATKGFFLPEIDTIIEGKLYLGNKNGSRSKELLEKHGITDILVAGNGLKQIYPGEYNYKTIEINDSLDQEIPLSIFEEAVDFIQKGKKVFVHCFAGVSRSTSMIIAYLVKVEKLNFQQALEKVQQCRWKACPNDEFQKQLIKFEQSLNQ